MMVLKSFGEIKPLKGFPKKNVPKVNYSLQMYKYFFICKQYNGKIVNFSLHLLFVKRFQ
jgi:hypothetical protein